MSGNSLPRALLQAPLSNGLGRYVCQLQRLTLKFCKSRSDNKGMRDFIEEGLVDFARKNPGTVVYVKPRRHRAPLIVAEYLNGNIQYVRAAKMEKAELASWINHLLTRSGYDIMPIYKKWSTKSPSIQGIWHPFMTHTDSGRAVLTPEEIISNLEHLSRCEPQSETAESKLVHISDVQKHRLNS